MSSSAEQKVDPAVLISTRYLRQLNSRTTSTSYPRINGYPVINDFEDPEEYLIQKAADELRETPENVVQGFKELRELLAEEPDLHIPDDDEFLRKYLRPCKWYAKSAFKLIKRFFQFQMTYAHICTDLTPMHCKTVFCSNLLHPLPFRTKDGSRIILMEIGKKWKPKDVSPDSYFRGLLLLLIVAMTELKTQIGGVHIIIDAEGLSLSHVTYLSPGLAKMILEFLQRCLPLRLKSVHVVNQSIFFNMAFAIFKPFMEEKIRKRIYFHGTNRESLMAHIDKMVLPKRQGGELVIDESFGTILWQYMCNYEDVFQALQAFGYKK